MRPDAPRQRDQSLWVDFDAGTTAITYLGQTLRAAKQRSPIRFYGNAVGVVVNYSPDEALRFDLNGDAVEILPAAYRGETLSVSIRGRVVSSKTLAAIFSGRNDSKGS